MGLIAEHFADDKGLVWPEAIAPAKVYLVQVGTEEDVTKVTEELYKQLTEKNIGVLYDDRDERPGTKFADADLLGIPYRVVVSAKTLAENAYELKSRTGSESKLVSASQLFETLGA
jgi:prolyl-tRNA synthetase